MILEALKGICGDFDGEQNRKGYMEWYTKENI